MSANPILETIRAAGLRLCLGGSNTLKVRPVSLLTVELRALIQAHKAALVDYLSQFNVSTTAENDPAIPDPDRWCWPHSPAMNTVEIDLFWERLARFTEQGMTMIESENLADRLVIRDRHDRNPPIL